MKTRQKIVFVSLLLGISLTCLAILNAILNVYVLPIAERVSADMNARATRDAIRDDYTLHTTPLAQEVVDDICSKFEIKDTSEHCQPGAVVYAPDFFHDIWSYFEDLPSQDKTYAAVQDLLGNYWVDCHKTSSDGHYRCKYDLRGDKRYPIYIYFDKHDHYFRIIANTGGS